MSKRAGKIPRKESDTMRTLRRLIERSDGMKHNCGRIGCSSKKGQESGCGKW